MSGPQIQKNTRAQQHKNTRVAVTYALMTCVLTLAGCAETQQHEGVEQICVANLEKLRAMQVAEDVLGKMHFTIAKADTERGLIRTRPLPGAQFFEFWRSDNVGVFNATEANLHSIRRIVELDMSQRGEELCITCNVKAQRLNMPEREISSSARAYAMFSRSTSSLQELKLHPEQKRDMAWVDLGNDTNLATEILKRIEKRMVPRSPSSVSRTSHESRATRDEK